MMREEEFIKAWNLQPGDEIRDLSPTGNATYVHHVLAVYRHTQAVQGRSSAVTVVLRRSYSPDWRVYKAEHPVKITKRK
jgi:hypothetical protein